MKTLAAIDSTDEPFIGEKAAHLSRLVRAGFPVPEAAILDTRDLARFKNGVPPPDLASRLSHCAASLRARGYANLVIRLSHLRAPSEPTDSPAKTHGPLLNIPSQDFGALLAAIRECLSTETPKTRVALLIQGMILPETSGSLCTIDLAHGKDFTHIIETMDGDVTVRERIAYDWGTEKIDGVSKTLTLKQIRELSSLAQNIQSEYGFPVHLQWTFRTGKISILQVRPITKISFAPPTPWSPLHLKEGGVFSSALTPFDASMYRMMLNQVMPSYFSRLHIVPRESEKEWAMFFSGQLYWNLHTIKAAMKKIPIFGESGFDLNLGIPKILVQGTKTESKSASLRSFFRNLRVRFALKRSLQNRPAKSRSLILSSNSLSAELTPERIQEDWLRFESGYFEHLFDHTYSRILFKSHPIQETLLKQREELRIHSIRMLEIVHRVFLEAGRRAVELGNLKSASDLFFLDYSDALTFLKAETSNEQRKILIDRIEKNRAYAHAFRNFKKPNENPSSFRNRIKPSIKDPSRARV